MAHQRAGEKGKPGIHIGSEDAKRAQRLGIEDESPSTVYTDSLKAYEKYTKIKEKDIKEARKKIISTLNDVEEKHDVERADVIGDLI